MATIRAIQGDWSFSQSVRSYFSCCLGGPGSKDGSTKAERITQEGDVKSEVDPKDIITNGDATRKISYGSVKSSKSINSGKSSRTDKSRGYGDGAEDLYGNHINGELTEQDDEELIGTDQTQTNEERVGVVHEVPTKEGPGSAYGCDDQDTSSDSDDEVLRRYQQSMQRAPSQRSIRSARSQKSSASKSSHIQDGSHGNVVSQQDHLITMADRGGQDGVVLSSDGEEDHMSYGGSVKGGSVKSSHTTASVVKSTGTLQPDERELGGATSPSRGSHKTGSYENEAFNKEQEVAAEVSPGGHTSPTSTERALSNYGDGSVSIGDAAEGASKKEHLFDVSDLQDREPILISKCGNLEVTFDYETSGSRMNVTIHKAQEIPSKDRGGANNTQIRVLLLPTKKIRHKTKVKQGENPEFMETFTFKVPSEEVASMGVRFRLYGCERMRRERMIGEVIVGFASLSLEMSTTHNLTLEPRSNLSHGDSKMDVSSLSRSDSASSTQSMQHGGMPELLIGLTYNGTTGRLSVEVIKGSNFKNMAMNRAPDTYAKLTLMSPNGQEIARSKTSIRRGQPNPLYKETFMFQVALFQLPDVTLMVSVYNKRSMKRKEMIGWFSLGYSSSGEEEVSHWNDMRESKGEPVCRWHVLLEA